MASKDTINSRNNINNSSDVLRRLREELNMLKERYDVTDEQIKAILETRDVASDPETVPLGIFSTGLGILEALILYLHEERNQPLAEIAARLNRGYTTITNTLRKARSKSRILQPIETGIDVPVNIFADRKTAPLQAITCYLHDERKLKFVEIATLLDRDPRNIGATYREVRRR